MALSALPKKNGTAMPSSVVLESEGRNLDSLVESESMKQLKQTLLMQWQNKDSFEGVAKYGITPVNRALFYGPPGNGKTVSAKMIASSLDAPLYRVACDGMLDSHLGGTESNMSDTMKWLSQQGQAVVLWDECETLFGRRDTASGGACSQAVVRAMQIFWQSLDAWDSPQVHLLATNMRDQLDSALLSRIDLQLEYTGPTVQQAIEVLAYWCEVFHEYGADDWGPAMLSAFERNEVPVSFRNLWNTIQGHVRAYILTQVASA